MEHVKAWGENAWKYLRKNWFIFFAILSYVGFTAYYMGPSITSCSDTVYGFGDNTAGPIWRASLLKDQGLIGARSEITNAPYGDDLENPVGYSLVLQTLLIKGAQALGGPICGYNLVNILGFVASALVMFGFVYSLTRRRWIALFAGYAVAFTPYYQMKVGGHPSYGFQALFIALIWLFYRLIKYRRKKDGIFLGLVFGASVYFDPYFSLFSGLTMIALGLGWLIVTRQIFTKKFWVRGEQRAVKQQINRLLLATGVMVLTVLPLFAIFASQAAEINDSVAASRGNVLAEARLCSNWPHEYLVPFVLHPLFQKIFGPQYTPVVNYLRGGYSCGIGEDTIGLSLVLVGLVTIGFIVVAWDKLRGRKIGLEKAVKINPSLLVITICLVGVIAFLFALPPVRYHGIPTPSYELLQVTQTWRTLTRFYMLVNITLVTLSAVFMAYFYQIFKRHKKLLLVVFVAIWLGVFIEYQAFTPMSGNLLSTFSYSKNVPSVYEWLKTQKDVNVIAEYPLEQYGKESDAMSYYLTMQVIHGKKLFNSALSYGPQEQYKDGLKNLSDPQTLGALRAYGVDLVVVHGVEASKLATIPGAEIVFSAPQAQFNINSHSPVVNTDNVVVLSLKNISPAAYYLDLGDGFVRNMNIIKSVIDWEYEAISGSKLNLLTFNSAHKVMQNEKSVKVCFKAQMSVPEEVTTLQAIADGQIVELGTISGQLADYSFSATQSAELISGNGNNMRITSLGCR